jgi:hypothetical protein
MHDYIARPLGTRDNAKSPDPPVLHTDVLIIFRGNFGLKAIGG